MLLDAYVDTYRPILLARRPAGQGDVETGLWLSKFGQQLCSRSIYGVIIKRTGAVFDESVFPHALRHGAATTLAVERPDLIDIVTPLLQHRHDRSREAYNLAGGIAASTRFGDALQERRASHPTRAAASCVALPGQQARPGRRNRSSRMDMPRRGHLPVLFSVEAADRPDTQVRWVVRWCDHPGQAPFNSRSMPFTPLMHERCRPPTPFTGSWTRSVPARPTACARHTPCQFAPLGAEPWRGWESPGRKAEVASRQDDVGAGEHPIKRHGDHLQRDRGDRQAPGRRSEDLSVRALNHATHGPQDPATIDLDTAGDC